MLQEYKGDSQPGGVKEGFLEEKINGIPKGTKVTKGNYVPEQGSSSAEKLWGLKQGNDTMCLIKFGG